MHYIFVNYISTSIYLNIAVIIYNNLKLYLGNNLKLYLVISQNFFKDLPNFISCGNCYILLAKKDLKYLLFQVIYNDSYQC